MIQSETPSLHKAKTTKSKPKQSLIRADLKPGLACLQIFQQYNYARSQSMWDHYIS